MAHSLIRSADNISEYGNCALLPVNKTHVFLPFLLVSPQLYRFVSIGFSLEKLKKLSMKKEILRISINACIPSAENIKNKKV